MTSFGNQNRMNLNLITRTFDALGVKPPAEYAAAIERLDRYSTVLTSNAGSLHDAVADAIDRGADPTTDPEVQRIVTAQAVISPGMLQHLTAVGEGLARETVMANADKIIRIWRPKFDAATKSLTEAHRIIGNIPLAETTSIVSMGGAAADAWSQAQSALKVIDTVHGGWVSVISLTIGRPTGKNRLLHYTAGNLDAFTAVNEERFNSDPWSLLMNGHDLSLPTLTEYRERLASLEHERQGLAAAYEQSAKQAFGKRVPARA